jgi:hypothetical protein
MNKSRKDNPPSQNIKTVMRKLVAIVFAATILLSLGYFIYRDLYLERGDELLLRESIRPIKYRLVLESFDFHNRMIKTKVYVEFRTPLDDLHKRVRYSFSPLVCYDGMPYFWSSGVNSISMTKWSADNKANYLQRHEGYYVQEPESLTTELHASGEPKFYPFDKYLIVGEMKCLVSRNNKDGKSEIINSDETEDVTVRRKIPGFLIRRARFNEVTKIGYALTSDELAAENRELIFKKWNEGSRFLLILDRPYFLRFMTIFLGFAALLSLLYITFRRQTSDLVIQSIGYFIAVWAIREVLSGGVGTFPTLIDYGTFVLYALLLTGVVGRMIWSKKTNFKERAGH